jgi:hypothetical protein
VLNACNEVGTKEICVTHGLPHKLIRNRDKILHELFGGTMRAAALIVFAFLECFRLAAWVPEKWFDAPKRDRTANDVIKCVLK